jgi:very-short-patch-repair endonuclease
VTLPRASAEVRQAARDARKTPTRSEALIWQALRGRKLAGRKFRRQHPVGPFNLDFYCAEESLVVEIDGPIHATRSDADHQRQLALESLGLRFVRIAAALVETDLDAALALIQNHLTPTNLPSPAHGRGAGCEG